MIRKLRGRLDTLEWGHAVIDVGGVGFLVFIPLSTRQVLQAGTDEEVVLHVHTRVRQEGVELFGFATREELQAFELVLQASGVGPKTALAALSTLSPRRLYEALANGELDLLKRIPGVGPRTAERMCVELRERARDHLGAPEVKAAEGLAPKPASDGHPALADAVAALLSLGYTRSEARQAVRRAAARVGADRPLEQLVRAALVALGGDGSPAGER